MPTPIIKTQQRHTQVVQALQGAWEDTCLKDKLKLDLEGPTNTFGRALKQACKEHTAFKAPMQVAMNLSIKDAWVREYGVGTQRNNHGH